ncbi:MAG: hypothetical protein HY319_03625 [Armatimonadetes bacterium]|nr:hypothetical protein [Armatimonadota bacterium]
MRKALLILAVLSLLLFPLVRPGEGKPTAPEDVERIHQEIVAFNMIQGLYLTPEQANRLLPLARECNRILEERNRRQETHRQEILDVLTAMRGELHQQGQVSESTRQRHDKLHGELEGAKDRELEVLAGLTRQARGVLNENQLELVARFKPCLIPPDDSREARTGQAGGDHLVRAFERARELSDEQYASRKKERLGHLRARFIREFGVEQAEVKLREIEAIFDRARRMTPEEFALRKSELAAEIKPPDENRAGVELDHAVGRFLLGPGAVPALERVVSGQG